MTSASSTIAEQVAEVAEGSKQLPAEVFSAFADEQEQLRAAGLPAGIAAAGSAMPDGKLLDASGKPVTLREELAGQPGVIVFYRGAWCPYCSVALRTYQAQLVPELTTRGVGLIAISPQKPEGSLTTKESKELSYTVLSDPGNQIAGQLGILTEPSAEAAAAQLNLGLDLTEVNADGTRTLPMPTVVLVDGAGVIQWIDVHPDYTTRSEPAEILAAVAELG